MYWFYTAIALILALWILKWFIKRSAFRFLLQLSRKFREKFKLSFEVSKLHLTYLEGVSIEREGLLKVKIDYIGFSSKWLNSSCNKPLCLLIGPTTVNILHCTSDEKKSKVSTSGSDGELKDKPLLNAFKANMIKIFLQYFGIVCQNLSITFLVNDISIVWSCEFKIFLDTIANNNSICIGVDLSNCNLTGLHNEYPVLFLSHNLTVHCFIPPGKPINAMTYKVDISKLNLDISEEFALHLQRHSQAKKSLPTKTEVVADEQNLDENQSVVKYEKLKSILSIVPESVKLAVENFKVVYRVYRQSATILERTEDGHQLQLDCHCILSWQRETMNTYEASVDVLGFAINGSNQSKLVLLKKVFTQFKLDLEKDVPKINFYSKVDNCHFDFIYNEIMKLRNHFKKFKSPSSVPSIQIEPEIADENNVPVQASQVESKPSDVSKLPTLEISILFENCSCDFYRHIEEIIAPSLLSCYLGQFCFKLTKDEDDNNKIVSSLDVCDFYIYVNIDTIFPEGHFSLPCQLEDDQPSCLPMSERHAWGRFIELGKMTHQCEVETNNIVIKSRVTYISCEWSLAMGLAFKQLSSMIIQSSTNPKPSSVVKKKNNTIFPYMVDIEAEMTNINLFSLGDKEGGYNSLLLKFDALNIASGTKQKQLMAETKNTILSQLTELQQLKTGDTYFCCDSSEYKDNLLMLPVITACVTKTEQNTLVVDVSVCETTVDWKPNLHMALYEQIKDLEVFFESMKELNSTKNEKPPSSSTKRPLEISVAISQVSVNLATAPNHSFGLKSKSIQLTVSPEEKKVSCPALVVVFDEVDVFEFQNISIHQLPANKFVEERQYMKLNNPTNSIWSINITNCSIWFPYKFDFAESLESFQAVIKMFKLLHKKPKPDDYIESLPADLTISCNYVSIQFDDDPFEVRLGDNYFLLSDEIEQAIEREQKLEAKLEQIKSQKGTMLSGKKLDELRRNLLEKNAQIYIERSKEMYEDRPPRKVLFRTALKGLQLSIFADESLHGKENILKHMASVDSESPIPDDIQFTTLWCRMVNGNFELLTMEVRDYPTSLLTIENFSTRGMVIGSEACGVQTATRKANIKVGAPWDDLVVTKNMPPLKFYYDLKWDMSSCQIAWGANFEPTLAMISQSFDLLSKPSVDPSTPMPFWDKIRLLLHGKLRADIADWNILLSASTNPYNTTETLEIEWNAVTIEWTNGNISIDGDFDLLTRTASKYDDSRVMHFPDFTMTVKLDWLCKGDPNDHHSVYPTHPEYVTDGKKHDSFKMFRSRNVDMNIDFATSVKKDRLDNTDDLPSVFLYASTFRWFQTYQAVVLNRVSRPIKRGVYFKNTKPRKPTLGRHLKILSVEFNFPCISATYWSSFQKELGFEASFGEGCVSTVYQIYVSPHPDTLLIRRDVVEWIMRGLQGSIQKVRMLLLHSAEESDKLINEESKDDLLCFHEGEEEDSLKKHYLFSVNKATYKRQSTTNAELFTHKILLENFKGAWTAINRELTFGLLEVYSKMQDLKKVLSSFKATNEASEKRDNSSTPLLDVPSLKKPLTRYTSGEGMSLLQKLVSEQSSKFIAQSEEGETSDLEIKTDDDDADILQRNWHIELVNSQVLLHGTETKGSIMLTSANATILKRLHCPVLINTEKLNKVTWSGHFRSLQYFSTIQNFKDLTVESIPWLTDSIIVGESACDKEAENDLPNFKNSEAAGSFVEIKKRKGKEVVVHQLQRVIARCECEFQYIYLGDVLDPVAKEYTSATPSLKEGITNEVGVRESLTLKHSKLDLSTSPSQYRSIADICQNLIFYTEPKKKEEQDRLEKVKFKLQLSTGQDLKGDVSQLQHRVRNQLTRLRHYERELFEYRKQRIQLSDDAVDRESLDEIEEILHNIQDEIEVAKEQLSSDVEELKILINAYTDVQETVSRTPSPQKGFTSMRKRIDVTFDDMQWSLTQGDGQLGIATVYVRKFRYNQLTYKDNRSEHCYEIGYFYLKNLLPNQPYREALIPHEVNIRRHLDKSVMLRIFTCVAPAVAGIMVKEHFEINVCPIAVRLTYKLVANLENFFFGKSQAEGGEQASQVGVQATETTDEGDDAPKTAPFKIAPQRPPPPRPPPPRPPRPPTPTSKTAQQQQQQPSTQHHGTRASFRRKISSSSDQDAETSSSSGRQRRPSSLVLPQQGQQGSDPTLPSPSAATTPITPKSASIKRASSSMSLRSVSLSSVDRDINLMKERASKNQTFIYIKIPEVPVLFSYKGEKDITITDANNFNLCLPTLEYHSRTWTWQDLFQALKKDYIQTLVPQILKEKLHLKSAGADTKPSLAKVDDTNKAKLLFGEQQSHQKKSAKKMLFGKLLKQTKSSSIDKLNEASAGGGNSNEAEVRQDLHGKGVEPASLEQAFNRLRDLGDNNENQSS